MKVCEIEYQGCMIKAEEPLQGNFVEIEKASLRYLVEKISRSEQCRYPLLAVRILVHVITGIDTTGRIYISARQLSKSLGVHYDTVTKCLKYLRDTEVLCFDRDR